MNKINVLRISYAASITAAVLLLAGCDALPYGVTPIKDITAAPANFEGKEVKLKGKVASVTKVPLLDLKAYTLRDDTGTICRRRRLRAWVGSPYHRSRCTNSHCR
mgnify:CR=1 FL=1